MTLESVVFWVGAMLVFGFAVGWLIEGFGAVGRRENLMEMLYVTTGTIIIFTASGWPFLAALLVLPMATFGSVAWWIINKKTGMRNSLFAKSVTKEFSLMLILFIPLMGFAPVFLLSHNWSFFAPVQLIFCLYLSLRYFKQWEQAFPLILAPLQHAFAVASLGLVLLFFPVMGAVIWAF